MKKNQWTQDEIDIIKQFGDNKNSKELQELLPNRTIMSIVSKCKKLKINKTKEFLSNHGKKHLVKNRNPEWQYHKLDQNTTIDSLDNETYQVLIGSILGKGCVKKQSGSKGFLLKETGSKTDWLEWKRKMLNCFCPSNISGREFNTPIHPIFQQLREDIYVDNKKYRMPEKYIEKLDELGLLIWYVDKGENGFIKFTFSEKDMENAINVINKNLKTNCYVVYNKIEIPDEMKQRWSHLIDKYEMP